MRFFGQHGIAIGPILFIVALLGLLAAAIAAGGSSFSGGTSTESARAGAAAIMAYGDQLKAAVERMRYSTDFTETQISFRHNAPMQNGTVWANAYDNTSCSNDNCRVFVGGGIVPGNFSRWGHTPVTIWQNSWQQVGTMLFRVYNLQGVGTSNNDLALLVAGLRLDVGAEIARRLGQGSTSTTWSGTGAINWSGAVDETWFTSATDSISGAAMRGREAFVACNAEYCDYYRVLITR